MPEEVILPQEQVEAPDKWQLIAHPGHIDQFQLEHQEREERLPTVVQILVQDIGQVEIPGHQVTILIEVLLLALVEQALTILGIPELTGVQGRQGLVVQIPGTQMEETLAEEVALVRTEVVDPVDHQEVLVDRITEALVVQEVPVDLTTEALDQVEVVEEEAVVVIQVEDQIQAGVVEVVTQDQVAVAAAEVLEVTPDLADHPQAVGLAEEEVPLRVQALEVLEEEAAEVANNAT